MWRYLAIAFVLAGCVQLPPTPEDTQAKQFQAVPGKAVIYIVRTPKDSLEVSGLLLDDIGPITTYPQTYYRWEVAPGVHRVAGYGPANELVMLRAEAGKIYFLEHSVYGTWRAGAQSTNLRAVDETHGRAMVLRATLL